MYKVFYKQECHVYINQQHKKGHSYNIRSLKPAVHFYLREFGGPPI